MFLGVDGGGTKTALCLVTADGKLVAQTRAPSCHYMSGSGEGIGLVERVLSAAVYEICAEAGIGPQEISYAFFGLPGYGEISGDLQALDASPRAALGHDRYRCDNDMVCAWAGSLGVVDGINVIAGTGSMTYGERAGKHVRVGGWGELFGDEGSGYWIGIRALRAFSRMSDGRLPPGPLIEVLRAQLGLTNDLDLLDVVFNQWHGSRRDIAALSRGVVEAANLGDASSQTILREAAIELVDLVEATRRRLGFGEGETVAVSYSGGIFKAADVRETFAVGLSHLDADYQLRPPLYPPVVGAAIYAAREAGSPLAGAALELLRSESGNTLVGEA